MQVMFSRHLSITWPETERNILSVKLISCCFGCSSVILKKKKNIYIALDTATFNALFFSRSDLLHVNIPIGTENLHEETEIIQQSHPQPSGEEHRHFQDADIRDFPARHALHAVPALPWYRQRLREQQHVHLDRAQSHQYSLQHIPSHISRQQSRSIRIHKKEILAVLLQEDIRVFFRHGNCSKKGKHGVCK